MELEYGEPHYGGSGATRLQSDYTRIAETASRLLDLRLSSVEHAHAAISGLDVADVAYGNLSGAAQFTTAHRCSVADAAYTVELLGQALEGDADRLFQVAFNHRDADRAAAARSRVAEVAR